MIISKYVTTKWCPANKEYFISKGYSFKGFGRKFNVNVKDLKIRSNIDIEVKCDICGEEKTTRYSTYTRSVEKHGEYWCHSCNLKNKAKYSIEDIKGTLNEFGYSLIDDLGYHKMHDKIKIRCDKGHTYISEFNSFKCGYRCPICDTERWKGENNPNYNSNLTDEQRKANESRHSDVKYREWFRNVFKKDNYTCQCCKKHGVVLNAHHLDGYSWDIKGRYDINNGVTLCEGCHKDFHKIYGYGENTKEQYNKFILNKRCKESA
jgi:hypothetical protein